MEFLKAFLGDQYETVAAAIKAHNDDPANKDNQIKVANLGTGDYVGKDKHTALETAKNGLEAQLRTATDALKGFEGVDVKDLQGKITTLTSDLATQKTTHETQLADMAFNATLSDAIKAAGGRSTKAVIAEMDLEALKASKDQTADIKAAVDKCKESNAWMFGTDEPINNPVGPTGKNPSGGLDSNTITLRAAMGLGEEK